MGRRNKALPGTVTIPAGAAQIKVKLKHVAKIKLLPATDGRYILGVATVAKIKIIDNDWLPDRGTPNWVSPTGDT